VSRPRILHLLPHGRALGGAERDVLDLVACEELAAFEQRVSFLQPGAPSAFPPGAVLPLRAAVVWRPDVLQGWLLQGNLLAAALGLALPSARLVTAERNVGHALDRPKRALERLAATREDVVTVNSLAVRAAAIERIPARAPRMLLIPPGVPALPRPARPISCDAVIVGRLHPVKDHETALRAWAAVRSERPGATLSVIGGGPERERLEALAAELGIAPGVTFYGDSDPAPHVHGAKLLLLTSRAEGFSRALVEGLHAGLPVVATRVGGVDELPRDAVRSVPVGDAEAVARETLALLADPAARVRAASAAAAAAARYAPASARRAHRDLYELLG
jgi:glycosyltransferase involved in cell wall biosynthesis